MNVVGRKLINSSNMVGRKLAHSEAVGRKMVGNGLATTQRISRGVDVAARKIGNTSNRVNQAIGSVTPYINGIPVVEQLGTLGRDASKGLQLASQGVRSSAQILERESQLGKRAIEEMPSFI